MKVFDELTYKIEVHVNLRNTNSFKLSFLTSKSADEKIILGYDKIEKMFIVDTTKSSLYNSYPKSIIREYVNIENDEILLEIFIDNSVFEIFLNKKFSFSLRFYPSEVSNSDLIFEIKNGKLNLKKLLIWKMRRVIKTGL